MKVIENYLARFINKWKEFEKQVLIISRQITGVMKDLDIVGNNSLFQYLNTANTLRGKKRLLSKLTRNGDPRFTYSRANSCKKWGKKMILLLILKHMEKSCLNQK